MIGVGTIGGMQRAVEKQLLRLWPHKPDVQRYLLHDDTYMPMRGLAQWAAVANAPKAAVEAIRTFEPHLHHSWLYDIQEPVIVDSYLGNVFLRRTWRRVPRTVAYYQLVDCMPASTLQRLVKPKVHLPVAVSLRDINEGNIWHFFDDILPKIAWISSLHLPCDTPVLVGPKLWHASFFSEFREMLSAIKWQLHDKAVVVDRLIVGHVGSLRKSNLDFSSSLLQEVPGQRSGGRVLLLRLPKSKRYLANRKDVVEALRPLGFDVIEAEGMTLREQVKMLSSASVVVGVHGAGLVNAVHGVPSVTLVELFPSDFIHPHFAWVAREFGYSYGAVVGSALAKDGSFSVEPRAVGEIVVRLTG